MTHRPEAKKRQDQEHAARRRAERDNSSDLDYALTSRKTYTRRKGAMCQLMRVVGVHLAMCEESDEE